MARIARAALELFTLAAFFIAMGAVVVVTSAFGSSL